MNDTSVPFWIYVGQKISSLAETTVWYTRVHSHWFENQKVRREITDFSFIYCLTTFSFDSLLLLSTCPWISNSKVTDVIISQVHVKYRHWTRSGFTMQFSRKKTPLSWARWVVVGRFETFYSHSSQDEWNMKPSKSKMRERVIVD